ncbi:hypothetical protein AKJ16_DCAP14337 [Drosera capensis]
MMAVGCSVTVITGLENNREVKILEFVDTLLIILSGSLWRLSFLHVYHHAIGGYNVLHLVRDGSITLSCSAGDECNSAYSHVFVLFVFRNRNPAKVEEGSNGLSDCTVRLQLPSVWCDVVVPFWLRGRVFWFQGLVLNTVQRIIVAFVLGFLFEELQGREGWGRHMRKKDD